MEYRNLLGRFWVSWVFFFVGCGGVGWVIECFRFGLVYFWFWEEFSFSVVYIVYFFGLDSLCLS